MTPELKLACEVVFQEHRTSSHPIHWTRDPFRGRLSTGLSEMAKETLVQKNIICFPNPAKKINTVLNPAVAGASSYEEAEAILLNKKSPVLAPSINLPEERQAYTNTVASYLKRSAGSPRIVTIAGTGTKAEATIKDVKWYLKPVFSYFIWPVCAAVAGGMIAYLIGSLYTELFFDLKK